MKLKINNPFTSEGLTGEAVSDRSKNIGFAITVFIVALLPLFISPFRLNLIGKYISYAIVARCSDLIWGYTGILSLGHGVFFGLGGYAMGMYLKLAANGTSLPDFMTWSGRTTLPWFWNLFRNPVSAVFLIMAIPTTLAFLLGLLTFTNHIKGVYFSILSQALALVFVTLFIGLQQYTGGTNGLTEFTKIFGATIADLNTKRILYYVALLVLIIVYALFKSITN